MAIAPSPRSTAISPRRASVDSERVARWFYGHFCGVRDVQRMDHDLEDARRQVVNEPQRAKWSHHGYGVIEYLDGGQCPVGDGPCGLRNGSSPRSETRSRARSVICSCIRGVDMA